MIDVGPDDPMRPDVSKLLDEHLVDMFATSPAESVHALNHSALAATGISFWTAREDGEVLGCIALKELTPGWGEIKSMRTSPNARRRGVGSLLLTHLIDQSRDRGIERLSLETGTEDYFAPARALYLAHGFAESGPFAEYTLDPNSVYMTRLIA